MLKNDLRIKDIIRYVEENKNKNTDYYILIRNKKTKQVGYAVITKDNKIKVMEESELVYSKIEFEKKYKIIKLVKKEEIEVNPEEKKKIMQDYILVADIKGNKDLHEIAKKIHFEDGQDYLPKTTTRKQFMAEIVTEINWQLDASNPPTSKNVLVEELQKIIKIIEKEEKKKERSR